MQLPEYNFFCQPKINSGIKALENIPFELDSMNAKKPLIITDMNESNKGFGKVIINSFKDSNTIIGALYDDIPSYIDLNLVQRLAGLFIWRDCDSIIAIGNDTVMNTAKLVNLAVTENSRDIVNFLKTNEISNKLKPFIAIPTSSATGDEITDKITFGDMTYSSPYFYPDIVILDPRFAKKGDSATLAASAMTALTHSIEASTAQNINPMINIYASTSIQFIYENLTKCIKKPNNTNASLAVANAIAMSGIAFSNAPAGLTHLLGTELAKITNLSPGICMGIILPYTLNYRANNLNETDGNLLLALTGPDEYSKIDENQRMEKAIKLILKLQNNISKVFPLSLKELNISKFKLNEVADKVASSSKTIKSKDCFQILEQAWNGNPV